MIPIPEKHDPFIQYNCEKISNEYKNKINAQLQNIERNSHAYNNLRYDYFSLKSKYIKLLETNNNLALENETLAEQIKKQNEIIRELRDKIHILTTQKLFFD